MTFITRLFRRPIATGSQRGRRPGIGQPGGSGALRIACGCVLLLGLDATSLGRAADGEAPFRLDVARAGGSVLLSWPTNWSNAELQASSALSGTTAWQGLTQAVAVSGDRFVVTNTPASNPAFYRLRQQTNVTTPPGMALIPAGPFEMGDTFGEGGSDELPVHAVTVSAFYMDQYEVTKGLWDELRVWAVGRGYTFDNAGAGKAANHPVHTVNWYDVVKWCNARSEKEGRVAAYYTDAGLTEVYRTGQAAPFVRWDRGYRLPTEAEWEYAARGGMSGIRFPWGDTISHSGANYYSSASYSYDVSPTRGYHPSYQAGGEPYTSPVGSFAPNGYGLCDMAGNVWQWCWDWYGSYASSPAVNPRGASSGSYRVVRGGSWGSDAWNCRVTFRSNVGPDDGGILLGFRSVLPPGQP